MTRYFDQNGEEQDKKWMEQEFGLIKIEGYSDRFHVSEFREVEGPTEFQVRVFAEDGSPLVNFPVLFTWGDDGSGGSDPQQTNAEGMAGHTAGGGAYYHLPGPGPHQEEVDGLRITGLGWPWGTNHRHVNLIIREGEAPPPEPPATDFDIVDKNGLQQDSAWLEHFFGAVNHHVAEEAVAFRLVELRERDGGDLRVTVQDNAGNPLAGISVSFRRADGGGGSNRETDASGIALFPLEDDAKYPVPGQGPYLTIVKQQASDAVVGLGQVMGTLRHLDILFRAGGPSPEPPDPPAPNPNWARLFAYMETIIELLEAGACP